MILSSATNRESTKAGKGVRGAFSLLMGIFGRRHADTAVRAPFWQIVLVLAVLLVSFTPRAFGQQNAIAAGREHSLALRSDGQVLSFGDNVIGQLGNGITNSTMTNAANLISGLTNVIGVTSGGLNIEDSHSLVLKSDGTLWGFGRDDDGELGLGGTNFSYTNRASRVVNLTNVMGVSAGGCHTLALKSDYTVWAFGQNSEGQLGLSNNVVNTNIPVQLPGMTNVAGLSGGGFHSLFIRYEFSPYYNYVLWGCGKNSAGQLGLGLNFNSTNTPVRIGYPVIGAAAGGYHSLLIDASSNVWTFGTNSEGELGLGATFASTNRPVQIPYFSNDVVFVAGGGFHSLAVKSDGSVWAFGRNSEGQLGLGNHVPSTNRPVRVPGLSNVVAIAAGGYHSLAMTWDGTVWGFGKNVLGQLGNKTATNEFSPVPVSGFRFIRNFNTPYPTDSAGTPVDAYAANPVAVNAGFGRFLGTNQPRQYFPFVAPLDNQKGIVLDPIEGNATNYFPNNPWTKVTYQVSPFPANLFNSLFPLTNKNPLVAFGSRAGGSSLYLGQKYRFDVNIGIRDGNSSPASFRIYVYRKSDFGLVTNVDIFLPAESDVVNYTNFLTQGFTTNAYGLTTFIKQHNNGLQEAISTYSYFPYLVTHTSTSSDYFYEVDGSGLLEAPLLAGPLFRLPIASTDLYGATNTFYRLYVLDFEQKPAWHSVFVDHPQFEVKPMPEAYQGKSLTELLAVSAALPAINITNQSAYLALDNSPELRRHPILTNFVNDLRGDPVALANYVLNEIELTDTIPINGTLSQLGGVNRSALGTFQEGQGSPLEQCGLLVFLLRQANVPATYVFPTNNGVQMLGQRMNRLLGVQAVDPSAITNTLTVNWPWVAAWIKDDVNPSGRWVHIFPWLKDIEVTEGLNLYDYMPEDYNNGFKWLTKFMEGDTNIMSLSTESDQPEVLFPKFIQNALLANTNFAGISIDDLGYKRVQRRALYSKWDDFPRPFSVGSDVATLESLVLITNIFNKVRVVVSSFRAEDYISWPFGQPWANYLINSYPAVLDSGDFLVADMLNRKLVLTTSPGRTSTYVDDVNVKLSLAPFYPTFLVTNHFSSSRNPFDTNSISYFSRTTNFYIRATTEIDRCGLPIPCYEEANYYNQSFPLKVTYTRANPASVIGAPQSWGAGMTVTPEDHIKTYAPGGTMALCLNVGNVTKRMLDVHAQELFQYEQNRGSSTNSEITEGTTMYMMGMSYFEQLSRFRKLNEGLHKTKSIYRQMHLVTLLQTATNFNNQVIRPRIDVSLFEEGYLSAFYDPFTPNWTNALASRAFNSAELLTIAEGSAAEHGIINSFLNLTNAISTMKLLQTVGKTNILHLNAENYERMGTNIVHGQKLSDHDTNLWAVVVQMFTSSLSSSNKIAFLTPGNVTNSGFVGMGGLLAQDASWQALISGLINGGVAPGLPLTSFDHSTLQMNPLGQFSLDFGPGNNESSYVPSSFFAEAAQRWAAELVQSKVFLSPTESTYISLIPIVLNFGPGSSPSDIFLAGVNGGLLSSLNSSFYPDTKRLVADPVNVITGEFYKNIELLSLPGPMPLKVGLNYSSQNLAPNQFGYGWKLNYMPFLGLSTNDTTIRAAEMDGSVIAYAQVTNNVWRPSAAANPQMNNHTQSGLANLYNATLVLTNGTNYLLAGPEGSVRSFIVRSYPIYGTNGFVLNRTRPYLDYWRDNRGNQLNFYYGTDPAESDYGQMNRIESSNGNYLGFLYNAAGFIVETYTGDGRWFEFDYDSYGDLLTIHKPDSSEVNFECQHLSQTVTNGTNISVEIYSTHLITRDLQPDGRQLVNSYDAQRRVTNQLSTAGTDLNPVRTASFSYSNNLILTNMPTNGISGYTVMTDALTNTVQYFYTNSLITGVVDQLGQSTSMDWYFPGDTSVGAYQRSLKSETDKRGLSSRYYYDSNGNLLTNIVSGADLTGDGATNSVYSFGYGASNLLTLVVDPVGNQTVVRYTNTNFGYLPTGIERYASNGVAISTSFSFYANATNVVTYGTNTFTYRAFGLPWRLIRAANSPDAATTDWIYDGRGFATNQTQYTGTSDPDVTVQSVVNDRGEVSAVIDGAGRTAKAHFDDMGRPIGQEVYEAGATVPLAAEYSYYNANGEEVWHDGSAYGPEDYVHKDYDGHGRNTVTMVWRAQAKADGSGVEAPVGDDLFSTTFSIWDVADRLVATINPRGVTASHTYDALGQRLVTKVIDADGTALATNGAAYEPGGLVARETNALGGVTARQYTTTGKPKAQQNPDGSTNAWTYYLDGRPRREIKSNGAYWETTYEDANRRKVRRFYAAGGSTLLATNREEMDRRGNVIRAVNAAGFPTTNVFDGLDRVIISLGPVVESYFPPGAPKIKWLPDGSPTATFQQAVTNYYDAAGVVTTNVNGLGQQTISYQDALKRPTRTEFREADNTLAHEISRAYAPDHHSVTITNGSGTNAIVSTEYTDNAGHPVLSIQYPVAGSANAIEYHWRKFDVAGNEIESRQYSSTNGAAILWATNAASFDGLNRMIRQTVRDGAATSFGYNAAGNPTLRTMPGSNLTWHASYNSAGHKLQEYDLGTGAAGMGTNSFAYFGAGSPFAGLVQYHTNGLGVVCAPSYDDWLRDTTNTYTGSLPEQNLTVNTVFDVRGLQTSLTERFATNTTGPTTSIVRTYDSYGQCSGEALFIDGVMQSDESQVFDSAGRRLTFGFGSFGENMVWQADGLLSVLNGPTGNVSYNYTTAGLLNSRLLTTPSGGLVRSTMISLRDGAGQALSITNQIGYLTGVGEALAWRGDQRLSTHSIIDANFTDNRAYFYQDMSQRLAEERQNLDASHRWTNVLSFDRAQSGGPGVLTKVTGSAGVSPAWSGSLDGLSRLSTETNTTVRRTAYGTNNGPATTTVSVDGVRMPVTVTDTAGLKWQSILELTPGSHQVLAAALHPGGFFTAYATNTITAAITNDTTTTVFDNAGNLTSRVTKSANGQTNRTQAVQWDARGRPLKIVERDANQSGYDLTFVFDAYDRLLRTIEVPVGNGVTNAAASLTIDFYYDPNVRFLILGVAVNGDTTWKVMGPDLNGVYGGLNGLGGWEAIVPGPHLFCPIVSDARGNLLVVNDFTHGGIVWNQSRPTAYGSPPGYRPLALGHGSSLVESCAWGGQPMMVFGGWMKGHRLLLSDIGQWASADAAGHAASDNLMSYAGGDPINFADVNGLCSRQMQPGVDAIDAYFDSQREAVHRADLAADYESYWSSLVRHARGEAYAEQQSVQLKDLLDSGSKSLSYLQKWKFHPAGMFENALMTTAELSLMALPLPGVGLAAAAPRAEAILGGGMANFIERSAMSEIGLAGRAAAEGAAAKATQLEFNFAKDFGQNSGLVLGRGRDLAMPGALGPGEYKLGWFSVQETSGMEAEWAVNQSKLQNVMNLNLPIRDASSLQNVGGFYLNNERGLLQSAGWNYKGGYWVPPAH